MAVGQLRRDERRQDMARDSGFNERAENPHQGSSHGVGKTRGESESGDRERSIETGRDRPRQTPTVGRPQSISPAFGSSSSPFTLMRRMADDMDRIFQDFGFARGLGLASGFDRDLFRGGSSLDAAAWSPQLDVLKRGDKYVIRADLPGLKKEDVKVEVQDGVLSIAGERRAEHDETKDDVYRSERSYGRFYRALSLPENVNSEDCQATFSDGVLEVTFAAPKQPDKKAKQVHIR
jgi:HSP20 family protein